MKHSRAVGPQRHLIMATLAVALFLPLLLSLVWGAYFPSRVYTLLRLAPNVSGSWLVQTDAFSSFPGPTLSSPLFAALLNILTTIGADPGWAALTVSAVGWSIAAISFLAIGQSIQRPRGALAAALLLSFNPTIITTLGSPASWVIALGWLTPALLLRRRFILALITFLTAGALLLPAPFNGSWAHLISYGPAIAWSILLFIVGVGSDWLAEELVKRDRVRLPYPELAASLLVTVTIIFAAWQGATIWQLFRDRPRSQWQAEEEVAAWLRAETEPTATLLANERVGYLAQRPVLPLPALPQLETATAVQSWLQEQPIDYLVMTRSLPWQQLQERVWFRQAYEQVQQFDIPYLPQGPISVWEYREPLSELGPRYTINARVPDRLWIVGYQIGPQQVNPGETVQMALYIRAPEATAAGRTPFQVIIRLVSPLDASTVREWIVDLPQTIAPQDWQANQVIIEQFPLPLPEELDAGAYLLNLSLLGPDSEELWPLSLDNDFNRLDRVPTGYVIVPIEKNLEDLQPVGATFAAGIELSGFSAVESEPGDSLDVTLTWQVSQPLVEDFIVFVHLIDANGQLVANHDGIPGNGRFPTPSWQPGITIPDTHTLQIPPDLPAGEYLIKAGLYHPETGERLPAATSDGTPSADNAIILSTISR